VNNEFFTSTVKLR